MPKQREAECEELTRESVRQQVGWVLPWKRGNSVRGRVVGLWVEHCGGLSRIHWNRH